MRFSPRYGLVLLSIWLLYKGTNAGQIRFCNELRKRPLNVLLAKREVR